MNASIYALGMYCTALRFSLPNILFFFLHRSFAICRATVPLLACVCCALAGCWISTCSRLAVYACIGVQAAVGKLNWTWQHCGVCHSLILTSWPATCITTFFHQCFCCTHRSAGRGKGEKNVVDSNWKNMIEPPPATKISLLTCSKAIHTALYSFYFHAQSQMTTRTRFRAHI